MPPTYFVLPGDVLVFCQPKWLLSPGKPGQLDKFFSKVLHIPSDINLLLPTMDQVIEILVTLPLSKDHQDTLAIVTADLLVNAIEYSPDNAERFIDVGIQYIPRVMVSVGITDSLGPIPLEVFKLDPTTVEKLANLSNHGRGIYIARCLGDIFLYNPHNDQPEKEILIGVIPDEEVPNEAATTSSS